MPAKFNKINKDIQWGLQMVSIPHRWSGKRHSP